MTELNHDTLDAFDRAIAAEDFDEIENIRAAFHLIPHPDMLGSPCTDVSRRFLYTMDKMLNYRPRRKILMAYKYTNSSWITAIAAEKINGFLRGGEYWRRKAPHTPGLTGKEVIAAAPNWAETISSDPEKMQRMLWRGITNQSKSLSAVLELLLTDAESNLHVNRGTASAIQSAYKTMQYFKAVDGWPEDIDGAILTDQIIPLLDSVHRVDRNLGGWALGSIYGLASAVELEAIKAPTPTDIFALIAEKQAERGDIVDSFIDAARLEFEPLGVLNDWPLRDEFDWEDWLLDLFCNHESQAPIIGQPVWFPIHEWFSRDLNAVMRLIDNGKYFAAKMTAEEDWHEPMRAAVQRLAKLDHDIAGESQYSLEHYWPKKH